MQVERGMFFHNKGLHFFKMSVHLSQLQQSTEILSTDGLLGIDSLHTQCGSEAAGHDGWEGKPWEQLP